VTADEQVEAAVGLLKRSQLIFMLFFFVSWLLARFLQKQYLLIVTTRRILLVHIPAFLVHGSGYYQYATVSRPWPFKLPSEPKEEYSNGCKVGLPSEFAALVGRPHAYVIFGCEAEKAFLLARSDANEQYSPNSNGRERDGDVAKSIVNPQRPALPASIHCQFGDSENDFHQDIDPKCGVKKSPRTPGTGCFLILAGWVLIAFGLLWGIATIGAFFNEPPKIKIKTPGAVVNFLLFVFPALLGGYYFLRKGKRRR